MSLGRQEWQTIQEGEFAYHAAKDAARVREFKLPYWRDVLATLPASVARGPGTRVADLGCGGASILLAIEGGERFGIDPLIERYRESFPYLAEYPEIHWLATPAEEVSFDAPLDTVFAINSLDHVFSPREVAARIAGLLAPGGHAVVTLNTHTTRFFRSYYRTFYRFIDHHHPHQLTRADVLALFGALEPVMVKSIDDLWFPYAKGWSREVLKRPEDHQRRKTFAAALNPFKWPMGVAKLAFDMPPHASRPGQRSIYSDVLYVLRKPAAGGTG